MARRCTGEFGGALIKIAKSPMVSAIPLASEEWSEPSELTETAVIVAPFIPFCTAVPTRKYCTAVAVAVGVAVLVAVADALADTVAVSVAVAVAVGVAMSVAVAVGVAVVVAVAVPV